MNKRKVLSLLIFFMIFSFVCTNKTRALYNGSGGTSYNGEGVGTCAGQQNCVYNNKGKLIIQARLYYIQIGSFEQIGKTYYFVNSSAYNDLKGKGLNLIEITEFNADKYSGNSKFSEASKYLKKYFGGSDGKTETEKAKKFLKLVTGENNYKNILTKESNPAPSNKGYRIIIEPAYNYANPSFSNDNNALITVKGLAIEIAIKGKRTSCLGTPGQITPASTCANPLLGKGSQAQNLFTTFKDVGISKTSQSYCESLSALQLADIKNGCGYNIIDVHHYSQTKKCYEEEIYMNGEPVKNLECINYDENNVGKYETRYKKEINCADASTENTEDGKLIATSGTCKIYCKESAVASLPGNILKPQHRGSYFAWPTSPKTINGLYNLSLENTLKCKVVDTGGNVETVAATLTRKCKSNLNEYSLDKCTSKTSVEKTCPTDFPEKNGICTKTVSPYCDIPKEKVKVGNEYKCVKCQSGYTQSTQNPGKCRSESSTEKTCPTGYDPNNKGTCTKNITPYCTNKSATVVGTLCVICPSGYTPSTQNPGKCRSNTSTEKTCKNGYEDINGNCYALVNGSTSSPNTTRTAKGTCPSGYSPTNQTGSKACSKVSYYSCSNGYLGSNHYCYSCPFMYEINNYIQGYAENAQCKLKTAEYPHMWCSYGTLVGNWCYSCGSGTFNVGTRKCKLKNGTEVPASTTSPNTRDLLTAKVNLGYATTHYSYEYKQCPSNYSDPDGDGICTKSETYCSDGTGTLVGNTCVQCGSGYTPSTKTIGKCRSVSATSASTSKECKSGYEEISGKCYQITSSSSTTNAITTDEKVKECKSGYEEISGKCYKKAASTSTTNAKTTITTEKECKSGYAEISGKCYKMSDKTEYEYSCPFNFKPITTESGDVICVGTCNKSTLIDKAQAVLNSGELKASLKVNTNKDISLDIAEGYSDTEDLVFTKKVYFKVSDKTDRYFNKRYGTIKSNTSGWDLNSVFDRSEGVISVSKNSMILEKTTTKKYSLNLNIKLGSDNKFGSLIENYTCYYTVSENETDCICPEGTKNAGDSISELLKLNCPNESINPDNTCVEWQNKLCNYDLTQNSGGVCPPSKIYCKKDNTTVDITDCVKNEMKITTLQKAITTCTTNKCVENTCYSYKNNQVVSIKECLEDGNSKYSCMKKYGCLRQSCTGICSIQTNVIGNVVYEMKKCNNGKEFCSFTTHCKKENKKTSMQSDICIKKQLNVPDILLALNNNTITVTKLENAIKTCNEQICASNEKAIFRIIDLENPFPGRFNKRIPGYNWNSKSIVEKEITNARGVSGYELYDKTKKKPIITITLTPSDIKKIRKYNDITPYDNFNLNCVNGKEGKGTAGCISYFLHSSSTYLENGLKIDGINECKTLNASSTMENFDACYNANN